MFDKASSLPEMQNRYGVMMGWIVGGMKRLAEIR
jgi:hypothetical protein